MDRFIKKSDILAEIKKNLDEMPMQFDGQSRPDHSVEKTLADKQSPLSDNPALDIDVDSDGIPDSFEELIASERYAQVLEKLQQATGIETVAQGPMGLMQLSQLMMGAFQKISGVERQHKSELEDLAVDLVVKEEGLTEFEDGVYGIKSHPEKRFKIEAELVGMGQIPTDEFTMTPEEPKEEEFNVEQETFETFEDLKLERAKRRFVNTIMQGSSKRGHHMYALLGDELNQLTGSDELLNLYGVMMAATDVLYWQMPAEQVMNAGIGGSEEIDMEGDEEDSTPVIKAKGVSFPILLHELVKGIKEYFGAYSMDDLTDTQAQRVMELEDTLDKEVWDLRLGPAIWDRFRASYPSEIFIEDDMKFLQNALYAEFVIMDAKSLLSFAKEVISGSEKGAKLVQDLVDGIIARMQNEEYEETMAAFRDDVDDIADDTDDDDLSDFLGSLGIDL